MTAEACLVPGAPDRLRDRGVAAWREDVEITTYEPAAPEELPAFLDRRVYQGSSGRIYPMPFTDRVATEPSTHTWQAIHLENRWLRLMILPELGGRIHVALDKTTGYDFFYRNQVIKPALVGLAGPWMAGGVEFNWPQHHRPATWLPTDFHIEEHRDGSVTVWCSDHDPFTRMKGMHGIRLHPDRAVVELHARLYNRTDLTQTFLWWANVAAKSGPDYQSFFPGDVAQVADHAKRAVVGFPRADGPYYGIDYTTRSDTTYESGGRTWTGDRLDFYRNIPVPTSYMCIDSTEEFFGGYDHGEQAGFVHVADPAISVGKKQWTWGNAPFGWAWDDNLCDDHSSYVELMAGVFTDNQPDFAWLAPGETKVFTQTWFPISGIGAAAKATAEGAVGLDPGPDGLRVGVIATRDHERASVLVRHGDRTWCEDVSLSAARPSTVTLPVSAPVDELMIEVRDGDEVLLRHSQLDPLPGRDAAQEPAPPSEVGSVDELYRIGVHLEQNRHTSRSPEAWWEEALRRDPGHPDSATALGVRRFRQGRYAEAEDLLQAAVDRLTVLNGNPAETSALYHLGLVQTSLGKDAAAYRSFGRALWTRAWRAPAGWQLALADLRAERFDAAEQRLADVLRVEPEHLQARAARVWLARHSTHRGDDASTGRRRDDARVDQLIADGLALDPLDWWLRDLAGETIGCDQQTCVDVALEYARLGDTHACHRLLELALTAPQPEGAPRLGVLAALLDPYQTIAAGDDRWAFPNRLAEYDALVAAGDRSGVQAALGCWLYAHDRPAEAIAAWRRAVDTDPGDWVSHRNLGLALVNHGGDPAQAWAEYEAALAARPTQARLRYEVDQLAARLGHDLTDRLALLAPDDIPLDRDDAVVALAQLLITLDRPAEALTLLHGRRFQPWEGGEGEVLRAWDRAHLRLAHAALRDGDPDEALRLVVEALDVPAGLGEQRHPLANTAGLHLAHGDALAAAGRVEDARTAWQRAADEAGDFVGMAPEDFSEQTWFTLQALRRLGRDDDADTLAGKMSAYLDAWTSGPAVVDYFATSLPSLLLFAEDPTTVRDRRAAVMRAQLAADRGVAEEARRLAGAVLAERPDDAAAADLMAEIAPPHKNPPHESLPPEKRDNR